MAASQTTFSAAATLATGSVRDLLTLALESLPYGLVVFDQGFEVMLQNRSARDLLPDAEDLVASLRALAVESCYEDWPARLRGVLTTGRPSRMDVTVRRPEGEPETFLSITLSPLRSSTSGDIIGGILVFEDVSGRIGIERRLAISERMAAVGKLASRVAHELNNPLDGILRYTNLAIRVVSQPPDETEPSPPNQPPLMRYLHNVRSGILRMEEILASLLEFSRGAPAAMEQARLNQIIEDAIRAMEGRAQEARVAVVCDLDRADLALIRGSSLFQVFCNLIKNAIDAMTESSATTDPAADESPSSAGHTGRPRHTLTITTRVNPADVLIRFEDTGTGLPPQIEKVFEPFFTTKAPGKGTGLGLAICKELVEKYEGTIEARRREPRGSEFLVTLPLRTCAASSSIRDSSPPPERANAASGGTSHA